MDPASVGIGRPEGDAPARHPPSTLVRVQSFAFWGAAAAILLFFHATHRLDSDEGVVLNGAWNLLHGQRLYTDFFEFVAPGSFYLVHAAWSLLGPAFWVAKLLGLLSIAAAAAGVYRTGKLLVAAHAGTARIAELWAGPLLLCIYSGYWPAINHNTFSLPWLVWSTYFATRGVIRRSATDATVAGALCGVAVLFLQHRGALLGVAAVSMFLALSLIDRRPAWLRSLAAFVVAAAVPVAGVLLIWPAQLLKDNLLVFPATRYLAVNQYSPLLFVFTAATLAHLALLLRHLAGRALCFLLLLQAILFASTLQRPDFSHVTAVLFPALAVLPLLLGRLTTALAASKAMVCSCLLGLAILLPLDSTPRPRQDLFTPSMHPAMRFVREHCNASPYLYAGPFAPGYYYETGKRNPARYSILLTGLHTQDQFLEALRDIQARRPDCVVLNPAIASKFGYDPDNPLDAYVRSHYGPVHVTGNIQVWKRRSE